MLKSRNRAFFSAGTKLSGLRKAQLAVECERLAERWLIMSVLSVGIAGTKFGFLQKEPIWSVCLFLRTEEVNE